MAHVIANDLSLHYQVLETCAANTEGRDTKVGAKINFEKRSIEALKNISFELHEGARLALIGRNGGGKSTLLKVLSGILEPTGGHCEIDGKVSAIFNAGLGMRNDSTGLKNIQIRCMMGGLNKSQTQDVIESVIEFAELGSYINLPLRFYSSGMAMRLNFALSTAIPAQILLLDEWIGTGDVAFREKVATRMTSYVNQSNILILASHSMDILRKTCDLALWLEQGEVKAYGSMEEVADTYTAVMMSKK
ncbi:MAG: ATP-binding cassette domain-containing protein [Robiginitomaculum sp.]